MTGFFAASALSAECGVPSLQDQISDEASRIIWRQKMKKIEAEAAIDKETSQLLLGRLFNLETGNRLPLPEEVERQYSLDAKYFAETLRSEAAAKRTSAETTFGRIKPCDNPVEKP